MLRRTTSAALAAELFSAERALPLLAACWPRAVGPRLAERTHVLALEAGTLVVRVPDVRYGRILFRMRAELLDRLRELVGPRAPRALGFVEASVSPPEPPPLPAPRAAAPRLPETVAGEAERIADGEIRALFLHSAARYLSRREGS